MKNISFFSVFLLIFLEKSEQKLLIPLKDDFDSVFSYNLKTRNNNRVLWTRGAIHMRQLSNNNSMKFELKNFEVDRHENVPLDLVYKSASTPIWIKLDANENVPNSNEIDWENLDPRVVLYPFALGNDLFLEGDGRVNNTIFEETNTYGGWSHCPPTIKVKEDDKFVILRLFFNNKKCKTGTIYDSLSVEEFIELNYHLKKKQKRIVKIEAHYKDYTYVSEAEAVANIEFIEFERNVERD